jgi:hypothetical protein
LSVKNKYIVIITSVLVLIILIYSIKNSIENNLSIEKSDNITGLKNTENDVIISPIEILKENQNRNEAIYKDSYNNIKYCESLFSRWRNLFEIFSVNKALKLKTEPLNEESLTKLTEKVKNVRSEFKLGNVNALVSEYGNLIKSQCNFYKIDWRLILALIHQESLFNPEAVSHAGAFGLMQIMPKTGSGLQSELQLEDTKTPQNNLVAGIYYFATLVSDFEFVGEDKYQFALASYNAGLGRAIDVMTITYYFEKDYKKWDEVKNYYPLLSSNSDSIHSLVWPKTKRPPSGTLNNWREPYNYVYNVMFYYGEYKKYFESNLKEEKPVKKKKKIKNK